MINKDIDKKTIIEGHKPIGKNGQMRIIEEAGRFTRTKKKGRYLFDDIALDEYMRILQSPTRYSELGIKGSIRKRFIRAKYNELGYTQDGGVPGCKCIKKTDTQTVAQIKREGLKDNFVEDFKHKTECKGMRTLNIRNVYDKDNDNAIENMEG